MSPRKAAGTVDYTREIEVKAPCDRAYDAIATLDGLRGWWTTIASGSDQPGGTILQRGSRPRSGRPR